MYLSLTEICKKTRRKMTKRTWEKERKRKRQGKKREGGGEERIEKSNRCFGELFREMKC